MSGGKVPLRLISLILLCSLIYPARASYIAPKQIWTNKWDNCFAAAGARYQIEPLLLKAISAGESSLKPGAININKDRKTGKASSTDYGLMQINSTHIPKLIKMGVIKKSEDLITKPCLNIHIGSWILARHFRYVASAGIALDHTMPDSVRTDMKQESNMLIKYGEFIVT